MTHGASCLCTDLKPGLPVFSPTLLLRHQLLPRYHGFTSIHLSPFTVSHTTLLLAIVATVLCHAFSRQPFLGGFMWFQSCAHKKQQDCYFMYLTVIVILVDGPELHLCVMDCCHGVIGSVLQLLNNLTR